MKAIEEINFQAYLESVLNDKAYGDCRHFYTPTDGAIRPNLDLRVKRYQSPRTEAGQEPKNKEVLSVLDGLRKYQSEHVLLVGKPGSGKSTALEKLLLDEAEKAKSASQVKIPVLLRLRQYQTSVLDLVRDFLMGHGFLEIGQLEQLLTDGRFLLLLDGVNELPSPIARTDLENFRVRYRKATPMILTTRDLSLGGDVGIEHKLEMYPLSERQMKSFIESYLPGQGDRLLHALERKQLKKLGETPLLLLMLCDIYKEKLTIPENLGEAFQDFVIIFDNRIKNNVQTYEYSYLVWSDILETLAFSMMSSDEKEEVYLTIPRIQAADILIKSLNKPPEVINGWLEDLLKYHLLESASATEIQFKHQLFQEYYAASSLLRKINEISDQQLILNYINCLKWTESLMLLLAINTQKKIAVRIVKIALEIDLRLGAKFAGAVKKKFQAFTCNQISQLEIIFSLKLQLWGITRSNAIIEELFDGLNDDKTLWKSSSALAEIGSAKAIERLILLVDDVNVKSSVRAAAAAALGKIKSDTALLSLLQLLEAKDTSIISNAALAIGKIGGNQAIQKLSKLLNHPQATVRNNAARALGKIGSEEAIEVIFAALDNKRKDVCQSAALALDKIENSKVSPRLIDAFVHHEDVQIRSKAASALGRLNCNDSIPALINILEKVDGDYFVLGSAAAAIGNIVSQSRNIDFEVENILIQLLNRKSINLLGNVISALGKIGSKNSVPKVVTFIDHKNSYLVEAAISSLRQIETKESISILYGFLNHKNPHVHGHVSIAIWKELQENTLPILFDILNYEDEHIRGKAISVLGDIGKREAIPKLIEALSDTKSDVRRRAAISLSKVGGKEAVVALLKALYLSEKDDTRRNIAGALEKIGLPEFLPYLSQIFLSKGEEYVLKTIISIQERYRYYNYTINQFQETSDCMHVRPINIKNAIKVVVASPVDVQAERDLLPGVIDELNRGIAADRNLTLELVRWETDSFPGFHPEGPQGLIDSVLKIEDSDILIGIFWKRFGTRVMDANSGTEHEFLAAYEAWKQKGLPQIMVYFNQKPYTPSSSKEAEQWTQVLKFKENFPEEGLWWKYDGEADFERKVRNHLTQFIRKYHPNVSQSGNILNSVNDLVLDLGTF
jgi:HEAT repeat protein